MSHVTPLEIAQAPEESQSLLKAIEDKYGKVLNIFGTMAHQPGVLKGVAAINDGLQNDLPATLRELAYFKASQLNGCDYCSHYHRKAAIKAGLSDGQLDAIGDFESSDLFTEVEKQVLRYTEQLTRSADVDDRTIAALKEHLSDTELVTLAATVALANFTNRFNHGLGVELP